MANSGLLSTLLVAIVYLLQLSRCQDVQCSSLQVDYTGEPMSGGDLSVCSTDATDLQCCRQSYIDSVTTLARDKLNEELRLQLGNTATTFNNTVNRIHSYFSNDFVTGFIRILSEVTRFGAISIDFNTLERAINGTVKMIPMNILINDNTRNFNVTEVIVNIISSIGEAVALQFRDRTIHACVENAIQSNINETDVRLISRAIERLRTSFTLLNRVVDFLQDFAATTQFRFPQNCVRRFVELNFCARCTRQSPPLCSNTCGALVRGCLSAHFVALNRQFDILWNVSRQVLAITNDTLHTLFTEERLLIDIAATTMEIVRCTQSSRSGKRQADGEGSSVPPFIPEERMRELTDLNGMAFRYAGSDYQGPLTCHPSADERAFCTNGGTSARRQNCVSNDACTASCRCYDGSSERRTNTEEFNVDGIVGQDNNPAIDLDTEELEEIAQSIGIPASSFLQQDDITSIIPDGVEVPPGEPYSAGSDSGGKRATAQTVLALMMVTFVGMIF